MARSMLGTISNPGRGSNTSRPLSRNGRIVQVVLFDSEERPKEIRKSTNEDGFFDTIYFYKEGKLTSLTKDTDHDGKVNQWLTFVDEKLTERRDDQDGDGKIERITFYDADGLPREIRDDKDEDGKFEEIRIYEHGESD